MIKNSMHSPNIPIAETISLILQLNLLAKINQLKHLWLTLHQFAFDLKIFQSDKSFFNILLNYHIINIDIYINTHIII